MEFIQCCANRAQLDQHSQMVITDYIEGFLGNPHSDQQRPEGSAFPVSAHVCPFVRGSLAKGFTYVACLKGVRDIAGVTASVHEARGLFPNLDPTSGKQTAEKVILLIYPSVDPQSAASIIDGVQAGEKPGFVAQGMMIGQFHPLSEEPGVYNPDFRPLRSPIPMIAMRKIVPEDRPFLIGAGIPSDQKERYAKAWLRALRDWDPMDFGTARLRNTIRAAQDMVEELHDLLAEPTVE